MHEINFDTLFSPTHFYGGLSLGNIASMQHKDIVSTPREAALQGLEKMRLLHSLGVKQALIPPPFRPHLDLLKNMGFSGPPNEIVSHAGKAAPHLLELASSSAYIWMANSASCTPSCDTQDHTVHITLANRQATPHRMLEAAEQYQIFSKVFHNSLFTLHPPLYSGGGLGDEGAANHIRFAPHFEEQGVHLFVYGKDLQHSSRCHFPVRQYKEASHAIARLHQLSESSVVFAQQSQEAIDCGVFHNDVIAMGHLDLFIVHTKAYVDQKRVLQELQDKAPYLTIIEVSNRQLPLKRAVQSYLFNSQLVTTEAGKKALIAPIESRQLDLSFLPVDDIHFVDLTQSMRGGGGPACLRLPLVLTMEEMNMLPQHLLFSETLYEQLQQWIVSHFRETLSTTELASPSLYEESQEAYVALNTLLTP